MKNCHIDMFEINLIVFDEVAFARPTFGRVILTHWTISNLHFYFMQIQIEQSVLFPRLVASDVSTWDISDVTRYVWIAYITHNITFNDDFSPDSLKLRLF